jgi:arginine decarboxylase
MTSYSSNSWDADPGGPVWTPQNWSSYSRGRAPAGTTSRRDLLTRHMPLEMADQDTVIPMLTIADDDSGVDEHTEALANAIARHRGSPRKPVVAAAWSVDPEAVMAPARDEGARIAYAADPTLATLYVVAE